MGPGSRTIPASLFKSSPEAEYYDLLAIAYLRAVKEYNSKPELRGKYEFSTIAFQKMRDAKIKKYHAEWLFYLSKIP